MHLKTTAMLVYKPLPHASFERDYEQLEHALQQTSIVTVFSFHLSVLPQKLQQYKNTKKYKNAKIQDTKISEDYEELELAWQQTSIVCFSHLSAQFPHHPDYSLIAFSIFSTIIFFSAFNMLTLHREISL